MSGTRGIVLDGGERLRRAVAELPAEERTEAARRLGLDPGETSRAAYRAWLGAVPTTMARWLRLLPWGAGDRRWYASRAGADDGEPVGAGGEDR